MKLRKLISLAVTAAIVMANAVIISMPTASASGVSTPTKFTENFGSSSVGYTKGTLEWLIGNGFYAYSVSSSGNDRSTLYTNISGAPYTTYYKSKTQEYLIAKAATGQGSNGACMVLASFGETYADAGSQSTYKNIPKYGLGKTFPGVDANDAVSGSWEIEFAFKPYLASGTAEFAISINTTQGRQNIVSCDGTDFYVGYNNYEAIAENNVDVDILAGQAKWYKAKVYLNCDLGYYSVELRDTSDKLIIRRSPIDFTGTVKFLGFSALGNHHKSYLFVDDVAITKSTDEDSNLINGRESYIYHDDFSAYSGSTSASTPMTTQITGDDFFTSITPSGAMSPWRAYDAASNANYSIEPESGDNKLKLGGSGMSKMIYALPNNRILDATKERVRGMLKVSFKIKPESIQTSGGFHIELGNFANGNNFVNLFTMMKGTSGPAILYLENGRNRFITLDAGEWYDVDIIFDSINQALKVNVDGNIVSGASTYTYGASEDFVVPTAVDAIMFVAGASGSYALIDDVDISYYTPEPSVDTSKVVMVDKFGNTISGTTGVTTAVDTIKVPLGTIVNNGITTADFTLVGSDSSTITCTGTLNSGSTYKFGDSYTLSPSSLLKPGVTYTLTASTAIESVYGGAMPANSTYTFATTSALSDRARVVGFKDGSDNALTTLSDVTSADTVKLVVRYANSTASAIPVYGVLAYYTNTGKKLFKALGQSSSKESGAWGTDELTFDVSGLDLSEAGIVRVSAFLWTTPSLMVPYCAALTVSN